MRNDIKYMAGRDLDICGEKLRVHRDGASDSEYRQKLISTIDRREGGGPAFGEFQQAGNLSVKTGGVTLRDYFAAKAMQALVSVGASKIGSPDGVAGLSAAAFIIADAMLAERAK